LNAADPARDFTAHRLDWCDEELGVIDLPNRPLRLRSSFGSGLARRETDPPGVVWGIGDRGPNIKIKTLLKRYGLERLRPLADRPGAKVLPRLDIGPQIAKLRIAGDRVELVASLPLRDETGAPVSGLPIPGSEHARQEPAFDLDGRELTPDPSGFDTEGLAATRDGGFWVTDEYGPSLVHLDAEGRVRLRLVPKGTSLDGASYPIRASLPPIAARRHLNRGFEAVAISPDERWLFVAFQSPLDHPDATAHETARHVRIWRLDAATLEVDAQYAYPLDPPARFLRDLEEGPLELEDLKLCELACAGEDSLLVLERATLSSKIYRVRVGEDQALPAEHLDLRTDPTAEQLSARGALADLELGKQLLFDSDRSPEVPGDLEGMAVLSPTELLLVNDNDFGVEGAETQFWKIVFSEPVLA
jgi:hypothetical protein